MTAPLTADARFEALQRKLVPLWRPSITSPRTRRPSSSCRRSRSTRTIRGARQQAYEERFLFLLLLLRQPRARLIYVTSQAIHADIVDYYLDLLPGVLSGHAQKRLFLVSPLDGSSRPLTAEAAGAAAADSSRSASLIPDPDRAHLVPYNTTTLERDLAVALGIPMYGADRRHFDLGTKSGARRIFAEEGVSHPLGVEDLALGRRPGRRRSSRCGRAQAVDRAKSSSS